VNTKEKYGDHDEISSDSESGDEGLFGSFNKLKSLVKKNVS
jgi:hypothetical protein